VNNLILEIIEGIWIFSILANAEYTKIQMTWGCFSFSSSRWVSPWVPCNRAYFQNHMCL